MPVVPALVLELGGCIEGTASHKYELAQGYWVKGLPYFQREMVSPPHSEEDFYVVMVRLWDNIINGNTYEELKDVAKTYLKSKILSFGGGGSWRSSRQAETERIPLNDSGSFLVITENSLPPDVDTPVCHHWVWETETDRRSLKRSQKKAVKRYKQAFRKYRQASAGLQYGIGGFFSFEPSEAVFGGETVLTIAYSDSETAGMDESNLSI